MKPTANIRHVIAAALAVVALSWVGERARVRAALAAGTPQAFVVGARVDIRCNMLTSALIFPSPYDATQLTPLDAVGGVEVDCDAGRRASVRMDQGLNPAPGSTARDPLRRLRNGTQYLNYNLYEDAAHTTVWDDVRPGTKTARSWPVTLPVYGRIFAGQAAINGTYTDTIMVRIFF